jgi:hypothetical protein
MGFEAFGRIFPEKNILPHCPSRLAIGAKCIISDFSSTEIHSFQENKFLTTAIYRK